jgi:ABC-2 type transport system permease protein
MSTVIHDIGYRGYDGVRLEREVVTRALFAHSLRGAYGLGRTARSKVLPMLLFGVMCIPAFILAVVTIIAKSNESPFDPITSLPLPYASYPVVMQAALTIFLASQAPQAVSRDLRFNTLPLYFSRPLERVDYVMAKLAALSSALLVLLAAPLAIMYGGALLAGLSFGTQTREFALALVGAVLFAVLLAGVGLAIASLTPRRGFGVAAIITVMALTYTAVSGMQGIIGFAADNQQAAAWFGLFSPVTLVDGVQVWALGADTTSAVGPPDGLAGAVFLLVALAAVAGCVGLLLRRYRKVGV